MITINGTDIRTLGLSLSDGAFEALLTPAPLKDYISDSSPIESGTRYLFGADDKAYLSEREVSLPIHFTARNKAEFQTRYRAFCQLLAGGRIELKFTDPALTFHLLYKSCTSYSHYINGIAKFTLKVVEPNPEDRE